MNKAVFGKTLEHMKKHRNIKLPTTQARKNYLVFPNSHATNIFSENLLAV